MKNKQAGDPVKKLNQLMATLEGVPEMSKQGFMNIADNMGHFSGSFGASASRGTLIQERVETSDNMGLTPLEADLKRLDEEIEAVLKSLGQILSQKNPLNRRLEKIIEWGLRLEQKTFLPRVVAQVKTTGSDKMERLTMGSMVDNLMEQMSPLVNEVVSATQDARDVVDHLSRRLGAEVDASQHGMTHLRENTTSALRRMAKGVAKLEGTCKQLEARSEKVSGVVFEMVQAMQFDDIASQRIHHVLEAMRQAQEKLTEESEPDGTPPPESVQWFLIAMRISIGQLRETNNDLQKAISEMAGHLSAISQLAEEQVNELALSRDAARRFHQESTDLGYFLTALLRLGIFEEGLANDVIKSMTQGENGLFQAKRALDMLHMTAERLEKLCASLPTTGNKRLEALIESIRELAGLVGLDGAELTDDFDKASGRVQKLSRTFSDATMPKLMRANSLLRRIPMATQQVDHNNNDLIRLMNEAIADTHGTAAQIMLLNAEMEFADQIKGLMEEVASGMEALLTQVGGSDYAHYLDGDLTELSGQFEDLAQLYTMKSERMVHSAELGAEGEEDEGDDIELF